MAFQAAYSTFLVGSAWGADTWTAVCSQTWWWQEGSGALSLNTPYYTNTPLTKYASRLANFGILVTWLVPLIHSLPLNSVTHITVVSHRRPWVHLQCSRHVTVAIVIWLEGKRERRENLGCGQYVMLPLVLFWSALWCWVYLWKPKWAWPMYSFAPAWAPWVNQSASAFTNVSDSLQHAWSSSWQQSIQSVKDTK